jgi:rhamnosyltransferase
MSTVAAVGVVVPTLNAGVRWQACLAAIAEQSCPVRRRLVIESASTDSTVAQARAAGFDIIEIKRADFSHGGTRQLAVDTLQDWEIVVFLTQDAVMANAEALAELVRASRIRASPLPTVGSCRTRTRVP